MCFIAPDRNERRKGDSKPRDPESGMCFDHALVILGPFLFTTSSVCWRVVIDDRLAQPAEERPDGQQKLGRAFHRHMMQPQWTTLFGPLEKSP